MQHKLSPEERLIEDLERALFDRDIKRGFALLDAAFAGQSGSGDESPLSMSAMLCLAQWFDLGYRNAPLFDRFASQVASADKSQLRLLDYMKLRMTEAYQALAAERPEDTIARESY